ncbi:MAG: EF-P beta-lysylation protein EpmB [Chromatiales bacterium]
MIAQPQSSFQPVRWQQELALAITSPLELLRRLEIDPSHLAEPLALDTGFRMRVPRGYAARMRKGDPADPLLRQVLPIAAELRAAAGYMADPVGDLRAEATPGVLHKYEGRVLLVTTGACAIHCRYCFRRHFPYAESNPAAEEWTNALDYVAGDTSISEVILSGGDPLTLSDARLADLVHRLASISHLQRLRVHTRLPVVLPERIDERCLSWLTGTRLAAVVVIHANHANEIDGAVRDAMRKLRSAAITVLNQSVLLRGVNDSVEALCDLSEVLFDVGALPYYLHLLDPVQGAAHFDVEQERACRLMDGVRTRLPGYLVPRLVREQEGQPFKLPVL